MPDSLGTNVDLAHAEQLAERLRRQSDAECAALAVSTAELAAELRRLRAALRLIAAEVQRIPSHLYNSDATVNRVVDNIAALATRADR